MTIKARPLALLFTIGCAASTGCAVTTSGDEDIVDLTASGGGMGTPGATGGGTGVPATGGGTGVPATGGGTGVPATGGGTGVPATGGGTGVPGTGGGTSVPTGAYPAAVTPNTMSTAGAIVSGPWMGYAYTWKGMMGMAVVNPAAGAEFADNNLCAWGTLSAADTSVFGLGFSVAQAPGTTVPGDWDISGSTGLSYAVTNDGGTPLRIQVSVDGVDYCSDISGSGTLLWADLKTECWGTTGVALSSGMMESLSVVAPGSASMARSPAFCIGHIAPL